MSCNYAYKLSLSYTHIANIMTFNGVLKGGGGGKALLSWITCCKFKVDQKGEVTSRSQNVLEIPDGRAVQ